MVSTRRTEYIHEYYGTSPPLLTVRKLNCCKIHHLQAKLSLNLRTKLTRYTHDLYLSAAPDLRYYRVGQEGGLDGVDQYITSDISSFCDAFSQV